MRGGKRDRLVTRERQPNERKIGRTKIDLNVAIPELTLLIEKHVVRRHIDTRLGGRLEQFRMIEPCRREWFRWLIGLLRRGKARQPFAIEIGGGARPRKGGGLRANAGNEWTKPDRVVAPLCHIVLQRLCGGVRIWVAGEGRGRQDDAEHFTVPRGVPRALEIDPQTTPPAPTALARIVACSNPAECRPH